jgi:hypothetical protein
VPQSEQKRDVSVLSNEQRGHFMSFRPFALQGIEYKFDGEESNEKEIKIWGLKNLRFIQRKKQF